MTDCIIGVPTFGEVSIHWAMSLTSLAMPINFSNQFRIVLGKRIDIARNEIVESALADASKSRYLFFLDDDVIMPPNALRRMVHKMEHLPADVGAISGIYYSKSDPAEPLVFRERGRGSYWDWRVGDFFQAWAAGCGLVLIRTEALRQMKIQRELPWFNVDYELHQVAGGAYEARSITEDIYFYTKLGETIAPNGKPYSLWIDSQVQGLHFEKNTKRFFGLKDTDPQAQGRKVIRSDEFSVIHIGCGESKGFFDGIKTTRVDALEQFNPDIISRGDELPVNDSSFDIAYSAYLLHTFSFAEIVPVLCEWKRVLKPNGVVFVKVPDIDTAKEKPEEALNILYQGKSGFNASLAKKWFSEAGFRDLFVFTIGSELNVLGRKGE